MTSSAPVQDCFPPSDFVSWRPHPPFLHTLYARAHAGPRPASWRSYWMTDARLLQRLRCPLTARPLLPVPHPCATGMPARRAMAGRRLRRSGTALAKRSQRSTAPTPRSWALPRHWRLSRPRLQVAPTCSPSIRRSSGAQQQQCIVVLTHTNKVHRTVCMLTQLRIRMQ